MLKNHVEPLALQGLRDGLLMKCADKLELLAQQIGVDSLKFLPEAEVLQIQYPVLQYPAKIKSFNLDKDPLVSGVLQGIKGQYLLFDTGVINIRKFAGYEVELTV
jgi:hypothetical protein